MRRAARNKPLWILSGAALVILAATFSTRGGDKKSAEPVAHANPLKSPAAADPVIEASVLAPARIEPLRISRSTAKETVEAPESDAPQTESADESSASEAVGSAGMVVGIDPETGKPGMPSQAFRDAMRQQASEREAALSRSMDGLRVVYKPDGSKMVDLKDRFQDYAIVRIAPDGRKVQSCVQADGLKAALAAPPADTASDGAAATEAAAASDAPAPEPEPTDAPAER
ncbi:MAG TPA: hypothetical protein VFU59_06155 [Candidatus Eisenbacteria bacterium]|nr:hypothetical protein [Candidatus Eisenbacteria bacterium]